MADETLRVFLDDEGDHGQSSGPSDATRRVELDTLSPTLRRAETTSPHPLTLGVLEPGARLCDEYVVERTLFPHETQRPGLFLCSSTEGQVIVKAYAAQYPPKPELWDRLPYLHHPHLLRIFRTFEEDGRYFEVQEYCEQGTLEARVPKPGTNKPPVPPEWISGVMLPQVCSALRYLHEQEVIHRDIKPANIYLRCDSPETLVLADFDISSVLEQTHTSRDTQRAGGTWFYTAPEAFPRFIDDRARNSRGRVSRSSDYYSLGITIIEMLLGITSLHQCELPDLFDFYLMGGRVEVPRGIPGHLSMLLRGLLIRNRHTRWGADEIDRWLANQTSDDDLQRIRDDEFYEFARASRPYRLNVRQAFDLASLSEAMFREQEVATEDLITGDVLLNWIGTLNPQTAREIKRDRDKLYMTPPIVLHRAIMRCDPTRPFVFSDNAEAATSEEWITQALKLVHATGSSSEAFCTPELLYQLESWLRFKLQPENELADRVAQLHQTLPRMRLEELVYLFQPNRPYPIMRGLVAHTPKDVALITYGDPGDWGKKRPHYYDASYQRWFDGALCAWLRQRGLAELATQCDEVRERLGEDTYAAFETVLRLLDPSLSSVKIDLDLTEVIVPRVIHYGRQITVKIPYTTQGYGIPFAAVIPGANTPGVEIVNPMIRQREGTLEIHLDARQGQQVGKTYQVTLFTESGIAEFRHAPARFSYRLEYPREATAARLLAGVGIGAAIFGLPRIVAALLGKWYPIPISEINLQAAWDATFQKQFPLAALVIAVLLFLGCLYIGIRIWIKAIHRSVV